SRAFSTLFRARGEGGARRYLAQFLGDRHAGVTRIEETRPPPRGRGFCFRRCRSRWCWLTESNGRPTAYISPGMEMVRPVQPIERVPSAAREVAHSRGKRRRAPSTSSRLLPQRYRSPKRRRARQLSSPLRMSRLQRRSSPRVVAGKLVVSLADGRNSPALNRSLETYPHTRTRLWLRHNRRSFVTTSRGTSPADHHQYQTTALHEQPAQAWKKPRTR